MLRGMTSDLWRRIDRTFQKAVGMDAELRDVYLDDVCAGDDVFRSEVDRLLYLDSVEWDLVNATALESAAALLAGDEAQLESGAELGRYVIVEAIGRGGMGEVYHARDTMLNRGVALKLLHEDHTGDAARMERFRREAQAVSALNHPNILTIYELGCAEGRQFIATELIDGETLRAIVTRERLSVETALDIAIQTARALAAAHRSGIVHRDIKPENIMVRSDGYVKVLDFGLAKLAEIHERGSMSYAVGRTDISSMLMMGTPAYMSPEQISGGGVEAASDVFSLGTVLYEMLAGRPPFSGTSPHDLAKAILEVDPPPIPDIPGNDRLNPVLSKMLSKDRANRYQSAEEALADLSRFERDLKIEVPASEKRAEVKRRSRTLPIIVALTFLAALGFGSLLSFTGPPSSRAALESRGTGGAWATKASISFPRSQTALAVHGGVLYVFGGWDGRECTPFADVEAYDPVSNVWMKRAPMITARGAHGVAELGGMLYVVGGSVGCGQFGSSVEVYDPDKDSWSARTDLPAPRSNHAVAASNGKLYAIGGQTLGGEILDTNSQYDPATDSWTQLAPMPTPRTLASVAVVRGTIYVIGGSDGRQQLATVEAYDPATNTWAERAPMLSARHAFAVAELDGKIYAFGGAGNRLSVEAYDPIENIWTAAGELPARRHSFGAATVRGWIYLAGGYDDVNYDSSVIAFSPYGTGKPECNTLHATRLSSMSTARGGATAGAVGGIIYVIGGYDQKVGFLATNEAYDPATDTWTTKARMPGERETSSSNTAVVGEKLYVVGGNARGYCSNMNQAYDPATDSWATLSPMPTARCHSASVAHDGRVYVIGGTNTSGSTRYSTVEVYDPVTDKWTTIAPMPSARHHLGVISHGGLIYAIGGWNPELTYGSLNVVEAYHPDTGVWTTKAPLSIGRVGMSVGVLDGKIVVIGGEAGEDTVATAEVYDPERETWAALPAVPDPRALSATVTTDDRMYVFGGRINAVRGDFLTAGEAFTLSACTE